MKNRNIKFFSALLFLLISSCATTKRAVTSTNWVETAGGSRLYLCYWEGSCGGVLHPFGGCSQGVSRVKYCALEEDNTFKCANQTGLEKLLN